MKNPYPYARGIGDLVRLLFTIEGWAELHPLYETYDGVRRTSGGEHWVVEPKRQPALVVGVHPKHADHVPGSNRMMLVMCEGRLGYAFEDWLEPLW